ncbi:MAG: Ig-like domain-containing protein [Pirellulales bacterium]
MRKKQTKSAASRPDRRQRLLRVERLEERLALDAQGALVAFDPHFTLSFADDGVAAAGQSNSLAATFDAVAVDAVWHEQILRGFQSWASQTNADIGVVSDGGQAFGSPGATQGDQRFGDIRIGAIAISPEVGAVSVPVDNFVSGTWLADVLFNSQFGYQSPDEILAVALHEAGNVFGLEDSSDPLSPLSTGGRPTVKMPTVADIAALQSLHGIRLPDANEAIGGNTDNDSFSTAAKLSLWEFANGDDGTAPTIIYGDVTSASDVDFFYVDTPGDYFGPVTFALRTSGISLLQPDVTIYDAAQQQVNHATLQEVGGSVLTLQIPTSTPHQRYYVSVAGAVTDVFGIGGYSLVTRFDGINLADQNAIDAVANGQYRSLPQEELAKFFDANETDLVNDDGHADDEVTMGMELDSLPAFVDDARYEITASIADSSDVDYYVIKSPKVDGTPLDVMTVAARSLDKAGLIPKLTVLDEDLNPIAAEVVVNGGGELVVQVTGIALTSDYIIRVEAADAGGPFDSGNYHLGVVFTSSAVTLEPLATGTVGDTISSNVHSLYIGRPQLFHLVLEADTSTSAVPSAVVATIKDQNSTVVATIAAPPGERRSLPGVFLNPGTYTVEFEVRTLDGSLAPAVDYGLLGTAISDPFVGDPEDPNSHPFACMDPELAGYFCYPGNIVSPDPFLWDSFVASRSEPPAPLNIGPLVDLLLGDWWSWVWGELGTNGPPLSQNDYFEVQVGSGAGGAAAAIPLVPTSSVLANDVEPEGDPFVAVLVSAPTHGSLIFCTDGTLSYTPNADFRGTDSFGYIASDFRQQSEEATVRIVVSSGVVGDYDGDGVVTADDYATWKTDFGSIDELLADGNRNGRVDAADYTTWRNNLSLVAVNVPGDFNDDSIVDDADYLLWKSSFDSASDLRADGNHDGRVSAADYTVWRDSLSVGVGGGSTVPALETVAKSTETLPKFIAAGSPTAGLLANTETGSSQTMSPLAIVLIQLELKGVARPIGVRGLKSAYPAQAPSLLFAALNSARHDERVVNSFAHPVDREGTNDLVFAAWPKQFDFLQSSGKIDAGSRRWQL